MAEQQKPYRCPGDASIGSDGSSGPSAAFPPTDWGLVLRAGADSRPALERLCSVCWDPAYVFVRRFGYEPGAAFELVQEFFSAMIEQNAFVGAGRNRGPFRLWLLTELAAFLVRQDGRRHPGGTARGVSLEENATDAPGGSVDAACAPRGEYERVLALRVMERAFRRLQREQADLGQIQRFRELEPWLVPVPSNDDLASLEKALGLRATSVNRALHALRKRLRAFMREEIANLLEHGDDSEGLKAELDAFLGALRPPDDPLPAG